LVLMDEPTGGLAHLHADPPASLVKILMTVADPFRRGFGNPQFQTCDI
jgi:hypothetical protein